MIEYYPRAPGKWAWTLQALKVAWGQGMETVLLTGKLFNVKENHGKGLCPICGKSVHTSGHAEQLLIKM